MVERTAEVRVAKLAACGVFLNCWIQIADTWATDACGIINLEAMRIVKLVSHTQVGHPVIQVAMIVGLHTVGELGIEAAILIALAVAIGLIFRTQITEFINNTFAELNG